MLLRRLGDTDTALSVMTLSGGRRLSGTGADGDDDRMTDWRRSTALPSAELGDEVKVNDFRPGRGLGVGEGVRISA